MTAFVGVPFILIGIVTCSWSLTLLNNLFDSKFEVMGFYLLIQSLLLKAHFRLIELVLQIPKEELMIFFGKIMIDFMDISPKVILAVGILILVVGYIHLLFVYYKNKQKAKQKTL